MKSTEVTAKQLRRLATAVHRDCATCRRLKNRMVQRQFPEGDRVFRDVQLADVALRDLLAEVETLLSYQRISPDPFRPKKK